MYTVVPTLERSLTRYSLDAFFSARRYASAVYAVVVCPSVTSQCCIETTERIELVLARQLPLAYPKLL